MNYLYSNQYYPMGISPRLRGQDMAQPGMPYVSSQYEPVQGMPYASQQYGTAPGMAYAAMPGFPDVFAEEKQVFEDARRLQSFYPRIAQEIQQHVEEECDRMEYEGSMMFDEYPDGIVLSYLTEKILEKMEAQKEDLPVLVMMEREDQKDVKDLIQVVLVEEMHRRRCRHRRCRIHI